MFYYSHHIGDFIKDTSRLTDSQAMTYLRLIWLYYDTEKPFENNLDALAFKIGADTKLVKLIIENFFEIDGDVIRHSRCDKEIEGYRAKSEGGKKGAEKRWGKKDSDSLPITNLMLEQCDLNTNRKPLTVNHIKPLYVNIDDVSPIDCPHEQIVKIYHDILPELRSIEVWSDTRKSYLKQRWREIIKQHGLKTKQEGIEYFIEFFKFVRDSKFLMGKVERKEGKPFQADLEWILKPTNFVNIIERKYHK